MPKQPILRPSYQSDAKYFRRLAHAVEFDEAKPRQWRNTIILRINELITQFESADNVKAETEEETQEET